MTIHEQSGHILPIAAVRLERNPVDVLFDLDSNVVLCLDEPQEGGSPTSAAVEVWSIIGEQVGSAC
jgi:hypothetical protein